MSIKTSRINILNNPNKSFIQASFIDPKNQPIEKVGRLFLLIEINKPDRLSEKMSFIIEQLLEKNYYLNDKIFLSDNINGLKIESVFEASLVKTNRELLEFIDQEKINFNFKTLNITAGLLHDDQIHFSSMGQNKSFLIRKTEKGCNISDINPDDENNEFDELSSGKIFSSIISGELPDQSYIIFTNASLSQYLLNDDFIQILDELKLEGATEQIKNSLKKINNYSNFGGLLIKKFHSNTDATHRCDELDLTSTEKNTERLLTAPGDINKENVNKKIKNILIKINIFKFLIIPFKALKKIKIKKDNLKNNEIPISSEKSNKSKKILLIIIGVLLLGLITNFYLQKNSDKNIFEEESASSYEELINQKLSQIDSSLLYNNENRAKEIIEELRDVINSLSDKEKNKIKNFSELEKQLEEQIDKIQKMIKISEPREIANFSIINTEANVSAISMINDEKIYAADGTNNSIYYLNINDGLLGQLIKDDNISGEKIISNTDTNNNIYFLTENQMIIINPNEENLFLKILIENRDHISSFDIYNNRPYLLNKESRQIFRYNRSNSELVSPSAWIKNNNEINPVSIAIDYNIYVLDKNGFIYKYLEGNKINEYQSELIDPILKNPDILRVSEKYLFVLDKNEQRLIIYFKENGIFINQYYSEKFENLKDFIIDEKNKKAYLLNENKIYEINLNL